MKKYFNKILFLSILNLILSSELEIQSIDKLVNNLIINNDKNSYKKTIYSIVEIDKYPNLYFVNLQPKGFVIISKDDRAMPVLGYSFNNSIELNNIPIQLDNILYSYNKSIQYIIENDIDQDPVNRIFLEKYLSDIPLRDEYLREIEPMITANWNQGGGWNEFCPNNSVVGCVAVAMAQVMYYWQHPFVISAVTILPSSVPKQLIAVQVIEPDPLLD